MFVPSSVLQRRDIATVLLLCVASRSLYGILGVTFDASPFPWYMQFIDRELLETRLLESLWYYHGNPPLLNLLAGIGCKLFPQRIETYFGVIFHLLGLAVALAVYALTVWLSASRLAALLTVALLVFSPAFVLYENWLMYEFPAVALLTTSAVALYRYSATGKTSWGFAFFALLAALLLTRSLFHIAWLLAVVALLIVVLWPRRKQVLLVSVLPVLIVCGWYGKNLYLFGNFGASTWLGIGLSNISTLVATRADLQPLVADGRLSKWALVSRYKDRDQLFAWPHEPTGIPVLDQVHKTDGSFNYNNVRMIDINRHYTSDAITVIRTFPYYYTVGLSISNRLYFSPSNMNLYFSAANQQAAKPMEKIFNPLLYGVTDRVYLLRQPHFGFKDQAANDGLLLVNTSVALICAWVLILCYAYVQVRRELMARERQRLPRAIVMGFILVTAVYLYAVSTGLELAENYRYRFTIEPLMFVLAAGALTDLIRRVRATVSSRRLHAKRTPDSQSLLP